MPSSTESRIEELCAQIRLLCSKGISDETEAELKALARELRLAIRQHLRMAKSSLSAKKSAIVERDPEEHDREEKK